MALTPEYLHYPHRSYGMDHDRYEWSMLHKRPSVSWPEGKSIALWVNISVEHFPLNQCGIPFKVPGGMTMPYPDLRHYSLRDYGNRVGIYRIINAFAKYGIRPSYAINASVCERYPYLAKRLSDLNAEWIAHGWDMDHLHHQEWSEDHEKAIISRTLDTLLQFSTRPIHGWLSPARNESNVTPDLLCEAGLQYLCDWVNDDMPYSFRTRSGELIALPLSLELEDKFILTNNLHSESSYVDQLTDAYELLLEESKTYGGRILALSIHPWIMGQAHRMKYLETVLEFLSSQSAIWHALPSEIMQLWAAQQTK
jgi:allantoinase